MHQINWKGIDLNLLVVLDSLLESQSVSRAAEKLHLSQPAVSHALTRLRCLTGDPILVRTGRTMTPSPYALRIQQQVKEVLAKTLNILKSPAPFDPLKCTETFTLGITDYVEILVLPAIVSAVRRFAPHARIFVRHHGFDASAETLRLGEIDAAIAFDAGAFEQFKRTQLYEEEYVCLVARGHRGFGGRHGLRSYLESAHLQISPSTSLVGFLDTALSAVGITRQIAVSLPRYAAAASLIEQTDVIGTLPLRLAKHYASRYDVAIKPLPFTLSKSRVCLFWSNRTDVDVAHIWLRSTIVDTVQRENGLPRNVRKGKQGA